MRTVGTVESPLQLCADLYNTIVKIYRLLNERNQCKTPYTKFSTDKNIAKYEKLLADELAKFDSAFSNEIFKDSESIAASVKQNPAATKHIAAVLGKFKGIFMEMRDHHREEKRKDHFLFNYTHKLATKVKRLVKGVKRLEKRHETIMKREAKKHAPISFKKKNNTLKRFKGAA